MWILIKKSPATGGTAALVLLVLCLYPFVQFFKYINYCQHKDQVIIRETVCTGIAWSDDNPYYDGVDYLNFHLDVSFGKKEVVSLDTHTLVFKGDEFIGYINMHFVGNAERTEGNTVKQYFEPNTDQKLSFSLQHTTNTSWDNNDIFREIYFGNLEDYRFETNVVCVTFEDGVTVGHAFADFYYDEKGVIHYKDEHRDEPRYYHYDSKGRKHYDPASAA